MLFNWSFLGIIAFWIDKYRRDKTFKDIQTPARGVPYMTVETEDAYVMPIPIGIFYVL